MMITSYPRHDDSKYQVTEHNIVTCPPDLWPFIRQWAESKKQQSSYVPAVQLTN